MKNAMNAGLPLAALLAGALLATPALAGGSQGSQGSQTKPAPIATCDATKGDKGDKGNKGGKAGDVACLDDDAILDRVHLVNQFEITGARLALEKSQNEAVRAYATQMIAEHEKADAQAAQLATGLSAQLDATVTPINAMEKAELEKLAAASAQLQQLTGAEFDVAYVRVNVEAHAMTLAKLKMMAPAAKTEAVQQFVVALQEPVAMHLEMAQKLLAGFED